MPNITLKTDSNVLSVNQISADHAKQSLTTWDSIAKITNNIN